MSLFTTPIKSAAFLLPCVALMFAVFFTEKKPYIWRKQPGQEIKNLLNLFPNESSVQVFRHTETKEIFWEDPNNLIADYKKRQIQIFLKEEEEEALSYGLFRCLQFWNVPPGADLFVREMMLPISENIDVHMRGDYETTALMYAVIFGAEKAVVTLIERGANIEKVDQEGNTALHYAAMVEAISISKFLLQKGANVNAQTRGYWREDATSKGTTPLMYATKRGNAELVKLLLEWGADTKLVDIFDQTAFSQEFAEQNCKDIIREHEAKN